MAMVCVLTLSAQSIYDFKVKDDVGHDGCVLKRYEPTDKIESPTPKDKWKPENISYNEFGGKACSQSNKKEIWE